VTLAVRGVIAPPAARKAGGRLWPHAALYGSVPDEGCT
jgi:hypothetical protein